MTILLLPGINNSGPDHWQSLWEEVESDMKRFQPADWDRPRLEDWLATLERTVADTPGPCLLVAHSLACLLVAHWAERTQRKVKGALLVAVPDPSGPAFPVEARTFGPLPTGRLPWPSLIVASSNDPYGSLPHARHCAETWGAGLVEIGPYGHINGAHGLGRWEEGRRLLTAFATGIGA
ncbi:RBBP9/YdeN family alpha/beta hydrolase [Lacibacterium aquatile]|uniref:RBBP9/YdeN family alpha/beta hydrolase n=1 Tax=Lacibacterium aquatile TaxID=1168082 RepID=A0ABW5DXT9_9PROT